LNIEFYARDLMETLALVEQWRAHIATQKLFSWFRVYLAHPAYHSLVEKGSGVVPLIMEQYSRDQHGWWHELLYEITYRRPSDSVIFDKAELFQNWSAVFEQGML
jgi:hypothetical protein